MLYCLQPFNFHEIKYPGKGEEKNKWTHWKKKADAINYTNNKHLINKSDMQIGFVDCVRKFQVIHKTFFHLDDIVMLNAYFIIYYTKSRLDTDHICWLQYVCQKTIQKFKLQLQHHTATIVTNSIQSKIW